MNGYAYVSILAFAAVILDFINLKITKKLESTIAITLVAIIGSLCLILIGKLNIFPIEKYAIDIVNKVDFKSFLLNGILGFLLFAGALGINLKVLKSQKWEILIFALISTVISTLLIGYAVFYFAAFIGWGIPLIYALLFGALISPTDPIAVLAIIKKLRAPPKLSMKVEGESLFNDGIGLVIFSTLFSVSILGHNATALEISKLFLVEAVGGILYGFWMGFFTHLLIKHSKNMELILCLTIPTAGYSTAIMLGISGPLAMVVSGIIIGNITREKYFTYDTRMVTNFFWENIDRFLNSVLFLLIGLAVLITDFTTIGFYMMIAAIPISIIARYISLAIPLYFLSFFKTYNPYTLNIMTWGGLRGGLGFAMALSIPQNSVIINGIDVADVFILMSYSVVIFSIIVQGTTIEGMVKKSIAISRDKIPESSHSVH